jgi:hypothetical protein
LQHWRAVHGALKLTPENAALTARLFDAHFQAANFGAAKLRLNFVANPISDMFRQQLGAGVGQGQEQDILFR